MPLVGTIWLLELSSLKAAWSPETRAFATLSERQRNAFTYPCQLNTACGALPSTEAKDKEENEKGEESFSSPFIYYNAKVKYARIQKV